LVSVAAFTLYPLGDIMSGVFSYIQVDHKNTLCVHNRIFSQISRIYGNMYDIYRPCFGITFGHEHPQTHQRLISPTIPAVHPFEQVRHFVRFMFDPLLISE
jgi:hypothetical protein